MRYTALGVVLALALVSGCPGTAPPTDDAGTTPPDAARPCTGNTECDDGRYCNGPETCVHGRCEASVTPCMPSQECIDAEARCVTICALNPDADHDGVVSVGCMGLDCDDADPDRFPGHAEVCDDTAHDEDCNPATFGFRDRDQDGDVDAACCNVDPGSHARICGGDCGDERHDMRSGLAEICDGLDNDCDATIDEHVTRMGAPDMDFDLHGDSMHPVVGCAGDPGFSTVTDDCNDMSPAAFGAQLEICDGADNNCNGMSDEVMGQAVWYLDADGDGFGSGDAASVRVSCAPIPGFTTRPGDCDDAHGDVHPGASERCNGQDDDCNGKADYRISAGNTEDDDDDGAADQRCGGGDCDDANAAIGPDAPELMDGADNDCNGAIDDAPGTAMWWLDRDLDGYGDAASTPTSSATPIAGRVTRGGDCNDDDVYVHPRTADLCDGRDDDCDTMIDESAPLLAFFPDADHDGWATTNPAAAVLACQPPTGRAERIGDCDDADATRYPFAPELCNTRDDDCDLHVDETPASSWYVDADGDGVGVAPAVTSCTPIAGRVNVSGDCDDTNAARFPGNDEICDAIDDDCDTMIDENGAAYCGAGFHATSGVCTAGACHVVCDAGYADCDGDVTTGCEVATAHAAASCGSCTATCGAGDSCGLAGPAGTCDHSPIVEIIGGTNTVYARRATGGLLGWGAGEGGVLARPGTLDWPTPITIAMPAPVVQLSAWNAYAGGGTLGGACAVTTAGRAYCWGFSENHATGLPTELAVPAGVRAIATCGSYYYQCALTNDRHVYCRGDDRHLSDGMTGSPRGPFPAVAPATGAVMTDVVGLGCMQNATCVMRERAPGDRFVTCWGLNGGAGEYGTGVVGGPAGPDVVDLPGDLVGFSRGSGDDHICVIDVRGRAWCWGRSLVGSLGLGPSSDGTYPRPVTPLGLEAGVLDVQFVGPYLGCAIRGGTAGARDALCWGGNATSSMIGWTGDGTPGPELAIRTPVLLGPPGAEIHDAVSLTAVHGPAHSSVCVVRTGSRVWCASELEANEVLGDGVGTTMPATFRPVTGLP